MPPEWTASGCLRRRQPLACASSCALLRRKQRSLTLSTPEGGGCSGDARPNGPRWRLTGLPGPTARGAASEEVASTEPCTQRRAHNGETALSPCLKAGACAPTEKVRRRTTSARRYTMSLGPVELLVVEFPGNQFKGEIVPALKELVEKQMIRIVDFV